MFRTSGSQHTWHNNMPVITWLWWFQWWTKQYAMENVCIRQDQAKPNITWKGYVMIQMCKKLCLYVHYWLWILNLNSFFEAVRTETFSDLNRQAALRGKNYLHTKTFISSWVKKQNKTCLPEAISQGCSAYRLPVLSVKSPLPSPPKTVTPF